ncbi:MAG: transketolase [Anaeroplasmataceae bacterium]|nr:transketolase [Anaeroplasmataceae bacterium]
MEDLSKIALNIRRNIIKMIYAASSCHPGGALSCADLLTVLYFSEMRVDVNNPKDENRDRFVLSKGHASAALYATLAEKGFLSKEELLGFRNINSILQGHPDMNKVSGVDMSTGSLGQGLSVANGMALAGKLDHKDYRVYCLMGDGEIEEGQIWEAAMSASHYKLDNLCAIVDYNNLQIDGKVTDVMNVTPIDEKFKSFGFNVININGNDIDEILSAFEKAKKAKERPTVIIAKTRKGKGVSFMEDQAGWHGKAPNEEEYKIAMEELQ